MSETTTELTQEEQYQAMLQQMLAEIDPMDLINNNRKVGRYDCKRKRALSNCKEAIRR